MQNHLEALLKIQIAMCEGWAKVMNESFTACERMLAHQAKIFEHPTYIRLRDDVPMGASWFDHYGKRAHDVDVEHV